MIFRINFIKSNIDEIEDSLKNNKIDFARHEISIGDIKDYFYIVDQEKVKDLDIYKDGKIYMQNPSTMYPSLYLYNIIKNGDVLDMCASPGGKSLHLQSISKNSFNITAIEIDKKRFERMKYNFDLQGANIFSKQISALDIDDLLKFDAIILDAPCSGSGTDKGIEGSDIDRLVVLQKKLIDKSKKLLKKGGILLYSTCSINIEENENQKEYILKNKTYDLINEIKISKDNIYEGFYIAILKNL